MKQNMNQNKYIMVLDEGTTSCRSIIFDQKGQMVANNSAEFKQIFPKSGWVEHNATEILNQQKTTIINAKNELGLKTYNITAVGITNQRETVVLWDKTTGYPIYNAIVWQDGRTNDYCRNLMKKNSKLESKINEKTGLYLNPYFSATKIRWILKNVDKAKELLKTNDLLMGTMDTWLIWNLSKDHQHCTDVSNASRTLLFNINTLDWDDELLELFEIPRSILPKVQPSGSIFGHVSKSIFSPNTKGNIPITAVLGDQQASLFGHLCFNKLDTKCTYGTGCFALTNIGQEPVFSKNKLLTTIAWQIQGEKPYYALEGSVFAGGTAIQWLIDKLHILPNAKMTDSFAFGVDDDQEVYMVNAFTGLGAPYWNNKARTSIFGIERGTEEKHIIKATLESIGFECNELFTCIEQDINQKIQAIKVDGGVTASDYCMQFQSSFSNKELLKPINLESTATGAAFMAGLTAKIWTKDQLQDLYIIKLKYQNQFNDKMRQHKMLYWKKAIKATLLFAEDKIN